MSTGGSKYRQRHASLVASRSMHTRSGPSTLSRAKSTPVHMMKAASFNSEVENSVIDVGAFSVEPKASQYGPRAELDGSGIIKEIESISPVPLSGHAHISELHGTDPFRNERSLPLLEEFIMRQSQNAAESQIAGKSNASSGNGISTVRRLSQLDSHPAFRLSKSSDSETRVEDHIGNVPTSTRQPCKHPSTSSDRRGVVFLEQITTSPNDIKSSFSTESQGFPSPGIESHTLNSHDSLLASSLTNTAEQGTPNMTTWANTTSDFSEPCIAQRLSPINTAKRGPLPYLSRLNTNIQAKHATTTVCPSLASSVSAISSTILRNKSCNSGSTGHPWHHSLGSLSPALTATAASFSPDFSSNCMIDGSIQYNTDYLPDEQHLLGSMMNHDSNSYSTPPLPLPTALGPLVTGSGEPNR